jgi:hypothetical protein
MSDWVDIAGLGGVLQSLAALPTPVPAGEDPGGWLIATKRHTFNALQLIGENDARFVQAPLGHLVIQMTHVWSHCNSLRGQYSVS